MSRKSSAEILVPMAVDVDGAPNAYGPDNKLALDDELNAHVGAKPGGRIVGYLTKNNDGRTPIVQGPRDPFPGFYISTSAYEDRQNAQVIDPRRYVNAAEINYTLLAAAARTAGVRLGDFCTVHSLRTRFTVYAIVGDSGNSRGAEGSLALLQRLGYDLKDGKSGGEDDARIVVRYFALTNPEKLFFFLQSDLETRARALDLDIDFSRFHPGDAGKLVLDAVAFTGAQLRVVRHAPFAPLPKRQQAPPYPGQIIKLDSADQASVRLVQQRLRNLGYTEPGERGPEPLSIDGDFGTHTAEAVQLFQIRHTDLNGRPLEVDGEVGSDTWGALFGRATIHKSKGRAVDPFLAKVIEVATNEIGVREEPPGSNKGRRVVEYQRAAGVDPGEPWCVAFLYFCFESAALSLGMRNPMDDGDCKTGSVLDLWNRARRAGNTLVLLREQALDDPSQVIPGMIFAISTGGGNGHVGLVVRVDGNRLETIEGNTNDGGSREGIGVFRRTGRTIDRINRGFIKFVASVPTRRKRKPRRTKTPKRKPPRSKSRKATPRTGKPKRCRKK